LSVFGVSIVPCSILNRQRSVETSSKLSSVTEQNRKNWSVMTYPRVERLASAYFERGSFKLSFDFRISGFNFMSRRRLLCRK
jgi:hypothetical protein